MRNWCARSAAASVSGRVSLALLLGLALGLAPMPAAADPIVLSTPNVPFLIPVNGQSGTLTIYSNGSAPTTSGFNSLGSQIFTLGAQSTSSGSLLLNLVFSGFPLGGPIVDAAIQFSVTDLDFLPDFVTKSIVLTEMALISGVNGTPIGSPINLANYLPGGTLSTDNQTITLNPISLIPPLTSVDFTNPFILSLSLSATVTNSSWSSVTLLNTPEAIVSNVSLSLTPQPPPPQQVPEPSTVLLMGGGLVGLYFSRRRRSRS